MRASLLVISLLAMLLACATPERCARLYPPAEVERTLVRRDTLVVSAAARVDTAIRWMHDTVIVTRERLSLRLERRRDTLRLSAECRPDTLRVPLIREVVRLAPRPTPNPGSGPSALLLAAGAVAALLIRRFLFS